MLAQVQFSGPTRLPLKGQLSTQIDQKYGGAVYLVIVLILETIYTRSTPFEHFFATISLK